MERLKDSRILMNEDKERCRMIEGERSHMGMWG